MSSQTLEIDAEAFAAMRDHVEQHYPLEACGFFYGSDDSVRRISLARPVSNSKPGDQRRRFEISAQDYMRAERYALENDLDLLGIFHSHPDHPAAPSAHDLAQAVPFFSYIILSVAKTGVADFTSWRLDAQRRFRQETFSENPVQSNQ